MKNEELRMKNSMQAKQFFILHSSFFILHSEKLSSMMSVIISSILMPAARACCGMKLVAVIPGVVLISSKLIFSPSVMI